MFAVDYVGVRVVGNRQIPKPTIGSWNLIKCPCNFFIFVFLTVVTTNGKNTFRPEPFRISIRIVSGLLTMLFIKGSLIPKFIIFEIVKVNPTCGDKIFRSNQTSINFLPEGMVLNNL